MTEEKPKGQGLGRDDDGNVDDRRIAGWITLIAMLGIAFYGIRHEATFTPELVKPLMLGAVGLLGATVAEKFKR